MKKLLLLASALFLAACSAPQPPQLNLIMTPVVNQPTIAQQQSFSLTSKDLRSAQYVALVDSGRNNVEPLHARQNLRISLENALAEQFQAQGFTLAVNSENSLVAQLQEALVNIKHSVLEHEMDANITVVLIAETPQGKLTKTYNATSQRSALFQASEEDITAILNNTFDLIFKEIANDNELKTYMLERFK